MGRFADPSLSHTARSLRSNHGLGAQSPHTHQPRQRLLAVACQFPRAMDAALATASAWNADFSEGDALEELLAMNLAVGPG